MRTLALIALSAFLSLNAADTDKAPQLAAEYSCTMTIVKDGETKNIKMVQGAKGNRRMEITEAGQRMVTLVLPEAKRFVMMIPDQKMKMELPMSGVAQMQKSDPSMDPNATWKKVGTETVNKVECDKYEFTAGGSTGTAWIDSKRSVLVRVKSPEIVDFTNYQVGAQKADLFVVPADYTSMGGGMP